MSRRPDLATVTSWTTRPARAGDGTGKSYEYVRRADFERLRDAGGFLEWAQVHGELYGTPRDAVERLLGEGKTVFLEIDVQGAEQVRRNYPAAVTVFVEPPSWETLEERLTRRGTEDPAGLRKRLETARRELEQAGHFGHRVVNEQLERAVDEVDRILGPAPKKTR